MFNEEKSFIMGTIGTLIGLISITPMLTTWRRWAAAIFLIVGIGFLIHGFYLRANRERITMKNIESKIREWLDKVGLNHPVVNWAPWYFGFNVNLSRLPVFVARTRARADCLTLIGRIIGVGQQQRVAFNSLSDRERKIFYGELALEIARAKILFNSDSSLNEVRIEKWIPITPDLTESDLLNGLNEIDFAATIIWNTIGLKLEERPLQVTQPSSTPDTEALPPSPTS